MKTSPGICVHRRSSAVSKSLAAFTLMEVMIALAIFFTVAFVILGVVSQGLSTARALRTTRPDASIIAADLWITNKLEEGTESGNFGKIYPNHEWWYEAIAETNGIWHVDIEIYRRGNRGTPESALAIEMFRPQWQTKKLGLQP